MILYYCFVKFSPQKMHKILRILFCFISSPWKIAHRNKINIKNHRNLPGNCPSLCKTSTPNSLDILACTGCTCTGDYLTTLQFEYRTFSSTSTTSGTSWQSMTAWIWAVLPAVILEIVQAASLTMLCFECCSRRGKACRALQSSTCWK